MILFLLFVDEYRLSFLCESRHTAFCLDIYLMDPLSKVIISFAYTNILMIQ